MTRSSANRHNGNARRIVRSVNFVALGTWYDEPFTAVSARTFAFETIDPDRLCEVNWPYLAELMNRNLATESAVMVW